MHSKLMVGSGGFVKLRKFVKACICLENRKPIFRPAEFVLRMSREFLCYCM